MDNIIELAPYLNSTKEDAEQEQAEPLEGVVVVEFNNESCEFRLGFSDKEENFKEEGPNDKIDEKMNEIVKSTRKRSLESKLPAAKRVKKEPSC